MKKLLLFFFALIAIYHFSPAQNVGINTTGAAPVNPAMLEVLQPSTTISSAGIYVNHSGAVAGYGYALQAIKNGAGVNNVALYLRATAGTTSNIAIRMEGSTSGTLDISPAATTTSYSLTMPAAIAATAGSIFTSSTTGVLSWTPTLPVGNGGTGATTLTGVLQGNGAGAFTALTGTTNYLARWTGSSPYLGVGVTRDDATSVGINAAPTATERLTVAGAGLNGINASSSLASAGAYAIQGSATGAAQTYGILGTASADVLNASGVRGYASGTTAGTNGVWGESVSGAGVYGIATGLNGNGIEGINNAAANTGGGSGVYGRTSQSGGAGIWGDNTHIDGDGGYGINSAAASTGTGSGFFGVTSQKGTSTSATAGVWGMNLYGGVEGGPGVGGYYGASGGAWVFWESGVSGFCNAAIAGGNGGWFACDNATGRGVGGQTSGTGASRGVYGYNSGGGASSSAVYGFRDNNVSGTGYGIGVTRTAVIGQNDWGNAYSFGVGGYAFDDANRHGGVIGAASTADAPGTWGSLGYRNSAASYYGIYYTSAGTGTGFLPSGVLTGIGAGGYGGVIGSWARGEVMGHISAGELFASYNIGNAYTSGYTAEIVTLSDKRVAAYSMTSTDIKVYNDGIGKLNNGKVRVYFDASFTELIGDNKPVVTITPMGQCSGIYIANVNSKGFDVIEFNNGNSNVEFSYIVISKRIDAGNKSELPEALSKKDFDEQMKGVMFNENILEQSAIPIWWDGTKIRFDNQPEPQKTEMKEKEPRAALPAKMMISKDNFLEKKSIKKEKMGKGKNSKDITIEN